MTCPNCTKHSLCGCKSCTNRRKGTLPLFRTADWVSGGNREKCPYCRMDFDPSYLMDLELESTKHLRPPFEYESDKTS